MSINEGNIFKAISAVMDDIGAVGKNNTNQIQKYKFRGIDDVMNALHPAMIKHHVFTVPEVIEANREERQGSKGGLLIYSLVKVKYTFYTDDGSSVEAIVMGEAMDSGDKSMNKALSAAFKYACFQTFCIPTEEMKDSETESPEIAGKSEEQLNKEMVASVDKSQVPNGEGVTPERLAKLEAEIERTGVAKETILATAKVKDLKDMSEETYLAIMRKLEKTKDKA